MENPKKKAKIDALYSAREGFDPAHVKMRSVYKRREVFLDQLRRFMKDSSIKSVFLVGGTQVDLFRLYVVVKDRGGFLLATIRRLWSEIALTLDIDKGNILYKTSLLRRVYIKCLLQWECRFDRGGIEPQLILEQLKVVINGKWNSSSMLNEKVFHVNLQQFLKQKGKVMTIDATGQPNLFRLYHAVRELGGFVAVTESKFWAKLSQEILGQVSFDLILCKLYVNNLLDWECEFDRGGLDSKSILAQLDYSFLLDAEGNSVQVEMNDDSFSTISVDDHNTNEDSNDFLSFNLQENLSATDEVNCFHLLEQFLGIDSSLEALQSIEHVDLAEEQLPLPLDQRDKSLPPFHLAFPDYVNRDNSLIPYHQAMAPFDLDSFLLDSTTFNKTIFDIQQLTLIN